MFINKFQFQKSVQRNEFLFKCANIFAKKSPKLHTCRYSVQVLLSFYTVFVLILSVLLNFVRTQRTCCIQTAYGPVGGMRHKCLYYRGLQKGTF